MDFEKFTNQAKQAFAASQQILQRYSIQPPFILYAGTIRPQKNVPRLVEAFAVIRSELENHPLFSNLKLVIIGDELSRYPAVRRAVVATREDRDPEIPLAPDGRTTTLRIAAPGGMRTIVLVSHAHPRAFWDNVTNGVVTFVNNLMPLPWTGPGKEWTYTLSRPRLVP